MTNIIERAKDVVANYYWVPFIAMRGTLTVWSCLTSPFFKDSEVEVAEVSELYVHPVRALKPVRLTRPWDLNKHGFLHDKGMCMLFKGTNERLKHTSKGYEVLFSISLRYTDDFTKVILSHEDKPDLVIDLLEFKNLEYYEVEVDPKGNEYCHVGDEASSWISGLLGKDIRLMFSPEKTQSGKDMIIQSLDPVLIIGESSLERFNKDVGLSAEMERFRPNIVSIGHEAYADESWDEVRIGDAVLSFDHRCTRCLITNVDPVGVRTPNTMDALRKFRPRCEKTNKPVFGSYFAVKQTGSVKPGDKIVLLKRRN